MSHAPPLPAALRHYEPLETIAHAIYGHVQKYKHTITGEIVAVKRMELSYASQKRAKGTDRSVDEDALTEIKINVQIKALGGHPFVLPMRDCFFDDHAVSLVMKYCEHGELLDVLNARHTRLTTDKVMRYFRQIVLGTNFLHMNGIAHRDLSLENVLVGSDGYCQITDFGLATTMSRMPSRPSGKLHYMAPESCSEHTQPYDVIKADVWSLGVILFTMVAGRYPFQEPHRGDGRFRLLEDFGVEYLLVKSEVNLQIDRSKDLIDLLSQLLTLDPLKRPLLVDLLSHKAWGLVNDRHLTTLKPRAMALPNPALESTRSSSEDKESISLVKSGSSSESVSPSSATANIISNLARNNWNAKKLPQRTANSSLKYTRSCPTVLRPQIRACIARSTTKKIQLGQFIHKALLYRKQTLA